MDEQPVNRVVLAIDNSRTTLGEFASAIATRIGWGADSVTAMNSDDFMAKYGNDVSKFDLDLLCMHLPVQQGSVGTFEMEWTAQVCCTQNC